MMFKASLLWLAYYGVVNGDRRLDFVKLSSTYVPHGYQSYLIYSVVKCCAVCKADFNCVSVSFGPLSGSCRLNDHNPTDYPDFYPHSSWDTYAINIVPCSSGWILYDRSCYIVVTSEKNWPDAESNCQTKGGHLVDIQSSTEANFVFNSVKSAKGTSTTFWTGLNDRASDEYYVYTSGASVSYTNYADGEPSLRSYLKDEDCIEVKQDREWNDENCDKTSASVCKIRHY